jgi:hypothetical protein
MSIVKKAAIGITAAAILALPLSACSSSGNSDKKPLASVSDLSKGKTTAVTLDKGFVAALTTLKLTPSPFGTATISTAGVATFPITGGNVDYYKPHGPVEPYVTGDIQHNGSGLNLTAGTGATAKKVTLSNFDINPGTSKLYGQVSLNGKVVVAKAYLFNLNGTPLKPLQKSGTDAILEGTIVEMSPDAAALLDKTFGTTAVKAGLVIGVAKITIATA